MNSKVKQALREGASVSDISAGLAYSVIKNAIHKVLKVTDPDVFGEHILVQGGTFRNPAVHKALENITGRQAVCPDIAELMGAYGAALLARDGWLRQPEQAIQLQRAAAAWILSEKTKKQIIRCQGCENQCAITPPDLPEWQPLFYRQPLRKDLYQQWEKCLSGRKHAGNQIPAAV